MRAGYKSKYLFTLQRMTVSIIILCLRLYRWTISPCYIFISGTNLVCRFNPSCSEYAKQAFQLHGLYYGTRLTLSRLLNCHPFSKKSIEDPVPLKI